MTKAENTSDAIDGKNHPIPEPSWFWRRVFTYLFVTVGMVFVGWIISKLTDAPSLKWIAIMLIVENLFLASFYVVGTAATDLTRIIQAASSFRFSGNDSSGGYGGGGGWDGGHGYGRGVGLETPRNSEEDDPLANHKLGEG